MVCGQISFGISHGSPRSYDKRRSIGRLLPGGGRWMSAEGLVWTQDEPQHKLLVTHAVDKLCK